VCKVGSKFDQRRSKLIEADCDDQGGFDEVHMAHKLIEMCNMDLSNISQSCLRNVEENRAQLRCLRIITSSISLFKVDWSTM
jgi:hypothetical protein